MLWWDFRGSVSSPGTQWSKTEIEQLKRSGVELLLPITRHGRENLATLRPVLGTKKQLVFMSPRIVGNEPAAHHPFRDRIQSLTARNLPIFDLGRHLADPNSAPALQLVSPKLHAFPHLRLPGIRRWWKLSGGQYLDSRDRESFSSAEKFIFNPTAWVLQYKARLGMDASSEMISPAGIVNESISCIASMSSFSRLTHPLIGKLRRTRRWTSGWKRNGKITPCGGLQSAAAGQQTLTFHKITLGEDSRGMYTVGPGEVEKLAREHGAAVVRSTSESVTGPTGVIRWTQFSPMDSVQTPRRWDRSVTVASAHHFESLSSHREPKWRSEC